MSPQDTWEQRFYEGLCLAAGGDFDAANAVFIDCATAETGNGEFVAQFLANVAKVSLAGRQAAAASSPDSRPVEQAASRQKWSEVFKLAPRRLAADPTELTALLALIDACQAEGHDNAEGHYLRAAVQAALDNVAVQRRAAEAFARLGHYDEAMNCWRRIEVLRPDDEDAPRMIAALTVARSRQRAGLENAGDRARRSAKRGAKPLLPYKRYVVGNLDAYLPSTGQKGLALNPIQQLEAAIRDRPSIPDLYLRLARVYLEKDRDYDAERLLAKGREATDRDARVQEMWEDLTLFRLARRIEMAEEDVKKADSPQTQEALAQARRERDRTALDIFRGRVKRQPTVAEHHYQLGMCLMQAEKLREACQSLEKGLEGESERAKAAIALGECFEQLGDAPKALAHYRMAAEAAKPNQATEKIEALNRAATLAAGIKLSRLAERYRGKAVSR